MFERPAEYLGPMFFRHVPLCREYFNQGQELEKQGRFEEAVDAYMNAVWADWNFADPYHRMALLLIEKGDTQTNKRAEWAIKKAIEIDPKNPEYRLTYGRMYERMGFDLEAEYQFRMAKGLDAENVEALMSLGRNAEEVLPGLARRAFAGYQLPDTHDGPEPQRGQAYAFVRCTLEHEVEEQAGGLRSLPALEGLRLVTRTGGQLLQRQCTRQGVISSLENLDRLLFVARG